LTPEGDREFIPALTDGTVDVVWVVGDDPETPGSAGRFLPLRLAVAPEQQHISAVGEHPAKLGAEVGYPVGRHEIDLISSQNEVEPACLLIDPERLFEGLLSGRKRRVGRLRRLSL